MKWSENFSYAGLNSVSTKITNEDRATVEVDKLFALLRSRQGNAVCMSNPQENLSYRDKRDLVSGWREFVTALRPRHLIHPLPVD
jgi:hypothetical protein